MEPLWVILYILAGVAGLIMIGVGIYEIVRER